MSSTNTVMAALLAAGVVYRVDVTEKQLRLYDRLLADLDQARVVKAIGECLKTCRYFPTVAEIREQCGESEAAAIETAWQRVKAAIGCHGLRPQLTPAENEAARLLGGWSMLGAIEEAWLDVRLRARFADVYQPTARAAEIDRQLGFADLERLT